MFTGTITPRFYETDAFGHINNTVITGWFETTREPIFRLFNPDMQIRNLPLILARIEVDFVAQIYYGQDITIQTFIAHIGNSSFIVGHEAWQNNQCVARGKAVQVYFDFATQQSSRIPEPYREQLALHVSSS